MRQLELLAPARNADIGIAAIDCGADAVYIAGPAFGARQAAGNSVEDIRRLCAYAHRFGARIFITLNTLIYEEELDAAYRFMLEVQEAGADGFIVQDLAVLRLAQGGPDGTRPKVTLPMHASTQCAIRTPEKARFYASLGFSRLVLERELSLRQIQAIREASGAEIECFIHGALCVCYSGQCYLSEHLAGRSANRGACMQACRSRYDLVDAAGKTLVRNKALLSLKDFNLKDRIGDLAAAGVCSFKIEGRLKNISYVRNVVREYALALDAFIAAHPGEYVRASFGRVTGGFIPDPAKTFNRGYTELFLDGRRSRGWAAMDTPKSMGEAIGTVRSIRPAGRDGMEITLDPATDRPVLTNGDGFAFATGEEIIGFRGDVCQGHTIRCKAVPQLRPGMALYRNISVAFERLLERSRCRRLLDTALQLQVQRCGAGWQLAVQAQTEDGRTVSLSTPAEAETATDPARMQSLFAAQLEKTTGDYAFRLESLEAPDGLPFLPASFLNGLRRETAEALDGQPCGRRPLQTAEASDGPLPIKDLDYKANVANSLARWTYRERGAEVIADAYELAHPAGAELMRSKYCIRFELGLCPRFQGAEDTGPLYLLNNGRRLELGFDCRACEMTVR
ncbi:MAG: U32 family peptidase [Bacteroidales bacterium]|nr:U32 family peptidase [Bacteroidales bacterium]